MKNKFKEEINEKISKIEILLKEIKELEQTGSKEEETEEESKEERTVEESEGEPEETQITKSAFSNPWFYISIIGAIIIIILFYKTTIANPTGNPVVLGDNGQYDEFAKYLTEQGVKMYGTEWCPHCKNQKALFGDSFQYIDYIDCDKDSKACQDANINGFPTWNINGQNYPGEQSLEELARLTNYTGELK